MFRSSLGGQVVLVTMKPALSLEGIGGEQVVEHLVSLQLNYEVISWCVSILHYYYI